MTAVSHDIKPLLREEVTERHVMMMMVAMLMMMLTLVQWNGRSERLAFIPEVDCPGDGVRCSFVTVLVVWLCCNRMVVSCGPPLLSSFLSVMVSVGYVELVFPAVVRRQRRN